jgi:FixJ family two-component response regulator
VTAARKVILVVDDDPGFLKGIARLLKHHGYDTEVFDSAERFLERAVPSRASCIVLDIHLDGMSGIELRRRLTSPGCPPVIFMTGNDKESTHKEALEAGCIAYLRKPFPGHLLISAIDEALR